MVHMCAGAMTHDSGMSGEVAPATAALPAAEETGAGGATVGAVAPTWASSFELGRDRLMAGDPGAAIEHFEAELKSGMASVDTHLLLAEALWQKSGGSGTDAALPHYEAASELAHAAGDTSKEGMIALGHGFALKHLGQSADALDRLSHAKILAEADGNMGAAEFAQRLLDQVGAPAQAMTDEEMTLRTWLQFAEAMTSNKPVVLFLRGTLSVPADESSLRGVSKLRSMGCVHADFVDISSAGEGAPEGLSNVAALAHLRFPQLFVGGRELPGFLDLSAEKLRELLINAGAELGPPTAEQPCHGGTAFADGLEAWEVALTDLVGKDGVGDWAAKAVKLADRGFGCKSSKGGELGGEDHGHIHGAETNTATMEPVALESAWKRLAPLVREKLKKQPEMPCGHQCSTCPTQHDCHLHEAVDIEDLI